MTLKNKFAVHIYHKKQCHLIQYSLDTVPAAGLYKNKEQTNDLETNAASQTTLNSLTSYFFRTRNNACQKNSWFQFARLQTRRKFGFAAYLKPFQESRRLFFITQRVEEGGQRVVRDFFCCCLKGMDVFTWGRAVHPQSSSGSGNWMTCQHSSPLITRIMRSRIFLFFFFPQRDDTKTRLVISCRAALVIFLVMLPCTGQTHTHKEKQL